MSQPVTDQGSGIVEPWPRSSRVSHLECARCGQRFEAGKVRQLCPCGSPVLVRYRLGPETMPRAAMAGRVSSLWRYREVLPLVGESSPISLGEGLTPLLHAHSLGNKLGVPNLYLKDE